MRAATRRALPGGKAAPTDSLLLPVPLTLCTGTQEGWVSPQLAYAHKHQRLQLLSHALESFLLFPKVCAACLEGAEVAERARGTVQTWFSSYLWITDALIAPRLAV